MADLRHGASSNSCLALVGAVFAAIAALLGPQRASAEGNLVLYCAVQEEWCRNMVADFERHRQLQRTAADNLSKILQAGPIPAQG